MMDCNMDNCWHMFIVIKVKLGFWVTNAVAFIPVLSYPRPLLVSVFSGYINQTPSFPVETTDPSSV